jgi:hypothetical protein
VTDQDLGLLDVTIDRQGRYLLLALVCALAIRVVLSLLKSLEAAARLDGERFWRALPGHFWMTFNGVGYSETPDAKMDGNDYLAPLVLGFLELLAYPCLMVASDGSSIGWWLAFKTIVQWRRWSRSHTTFNRFLVGNALVLLLAYVVLSPHVDIPPLDDEVGLSA